jgi:hypothetical protein
MMAVWEMEERINLFGETWSGQGKRRLPLRVIGQCDFLMCR